MKKTLTLFLSAVLLLTATLATIPLSVFAGSTDPIKATPWAISGLEDNSVAIKGAVTFTDAEPLSFTNTLGKKATLNEGKDFYVLETDTDKVGRGNDGFVFTMDSEAKLDPSKEKYFLFRFETNGPVNISPQIRLLGTPIINYNFWHTTTFEILEDGSNQWETRQTVGGNSTGNWSQIKFDEAFSGYIKIAYSDLCSGTMKSGNIKYVILYLVGMGEVSPNQKQATEITCGTFFTVTDDSDSTEIEVPELYKPAPIGTEPIAIEKVVPSDATAQNVTLTEVTPLKDSDIGASGYKATLTDKPFYSVNTLGKGNYYIGYYLPKELVINAADSHLVFYFKTDAATSIALQIQPNGGTLKDGETVYLLNESDSKWTAVKCVNADSNGVNAQIEFKEKFSGFVKIAYTSFAHTVTGTTGTSIRIYFPGLGKDGDNPVQPNAITAGPFFSVTSNSLSKEFNVTSSVSNDVNVDGLIDRKDVATLRSYLLNDGEAYKKYVEQYGNIMNSDSDINLLDLVKLAKDTYVSHENDGVFTLPQVQDFDDYELATPGDSGASMNMHFNNIPSPVPELSQKSGFTIRCDITIDKTAFECLESGYAAYPNYKGMLLGDITHIMFYVKVPAAKENYLAMTFNTDTSTTKYNIQSDSPYALLEKDSTEWEHYNTTNPSTGHLGALILPAGFEGYVKIPLTSLRPGGITQNTPITYIAFRFAYIPSNETITVGPLVGVTKDNDPGPSDEVIIDELPTHTTDSTVATINGGIFSDKVMLKWDATTNAKEYRIDAYYIQNGESGTTYKLASRVRTFTNSGTVINLEPSSDYVFVINALNNNNEIFATYKPFNAKTISVSNYVALKKSDTIKEYDTSSSTSPTVNRTYTTLYSENEDLTNKNPNRGFRGYMHYEVYNYPEAQVKQQFNTWMRSHKDIASAQVAVCYFYLPYYRGRDLDNQFFDTVQWVFDCAEEQNIQLIVRFAYYTYGIKADNCNVNDSPTTEDMMLHINQISDNGIIERNKDVIHSFQVGFVGFGGEWHTESRETDRKLIINTVLDKLIPSDIYAMARRPIFKDLIDDSNPRKAMVGFNHDSFTGIEDCRSLGGEGFTIGEPEWDEWVNTGAYAPQDAECQFYKDSMSNYGEVSEAYACLIGMSQVRMTTFSSENGYLETDALNAYDNSTMGMWKQMPITEEWLKLYGIPYSANWFKNRNGETVDRNVFEFIRDYLGYRFTVTQLNSTQSGSTLNVTLNLENHGFSAGFNMTSEIVILDANNEEVASAIAGNPKNWHCTNPDDYTDREQLEHKLDAKFDISGLSGTYKIALKLTSHNGATARLDNNIKYENGYNILHTFTI